MNRILMPLDGSEFAESALAAAVDLARAFNAELHLVQVHEFALPFPRAELLLDDDAYDDDFGPGIAPGGAHASTAELDAELREQARREDAARLAALADSCAARAGLRTHAELIDGEVVPTLARYIADAAIDCVVMTTHGRGGLSRVWLGSVADALVRNTNVPVLLLRPGTSDAPVPGLDGIGRVLVPLDGSPLAEAMLAPAAAFARALGAGMALMHAVAPFRPGARATLRAPGAALELDLTDAERYLERHAARLRADGVPVELAVPIHASPPLAIVEAAETRTDTLIALATHGRGGWARVALGSVADKVLRAASVPVLLYRPPATPAAPAFAATAGDDVPADVDA
jgi:nucleotide-binding universal stress UspA family protein